MSASNPETSYPAGVPHGKHVYAVVGYGVGDTIFNHPHPQISWKDLKNASSYSEKSMKWPFFGKFTHTFTVSSESRNPIGLAKAVIQTIAYHTTEGSEIIVHLPHGMGTMYYGVKDRPSWNSARIGRIYPHLGDEFRAGFDMLR